MSVRETCNNTDTWFPLQNIPQHIDHHHDMETLSINDHEFIIASDSRQCDGYVNKYNAQTNEWTEFVETAGFLCIDDPRIAYDTDTKILYISSKSDCEDKLCFQEFHCGKNEISMLITNDPNAHFIVNVKGTIHVVGNFGYYENRIKHCIWNPTEYRFKQIHSFKEYQFLANSSLIYVPSKHMLLLIGGYDYHHIEEVKLIGIWRCDLNANKWHKIKDVVFEGYAHSVALTSDEKNVIIAGGMIKKGITDNQIDTIYILNITNDEEYILRESKIACPEKGACKIVRTGGGIRDEMLVFGWIKCQFKPSELCNIQMVPTYLMHLIAKFYSQEIIHWINSQNNHLAISLAQILK